MNHTDIRKALTGDTGTCMRECDACGGEPKAGLLETLRAYSADEETQGNCPQCQGRGKVFRGTLVCHKCDGCGTRESEGAIEDCYKCDGTGHIPDEVGRGRIKIAVLSSEAFQNWLLPDGPFVFWDNRGGSVYQKTLESHVAAYVEPIDYLTAVTDQPGELLLEQHLREAGWEWGECLTQYVSGPEYSAEILGTPKRFGITLKEDDNYFAPTRAACLLTAVTAALEEK